MNCNVIILHHLQKLKHKVYNKYYKNIYFKMDYIQSEYYGELDIEFKKKFEKFMCIILDEKQQI